MISYSILVAKPSMGYALLDSGEGEKLERYGDIVVARPDPQALWRKRLPETEWKKADAVFTGGVETLHATSLQRRGEKEWKKRRELPSRWPIELGGLKFWIKLSAFKHTGVFPEQVPNWEWIRNLIHDTRKTIQVLNLFGYTGGATLAAASAGAGVVHLDGSKVAMGWARDNAELSGLSGKPIRWILDDARKFVKREIKRGRRHDGIIMDPPAFGHGPGGEVWKIEEHFLELLDLCHQALSDKPLFFIINGYASGYSAIAYKNCLEYSMKEYGGQAEIGELTIEEAGSGRLLPAGIFARWFAR